MIITIEIGITMLTALLLKKMISALSGHADDVLFTVGHFAYITLH